MMIRALPPGLDRARRQQEISADAIYVERGEWHDIKNA